MKISDIFRKRAFTGVAIFCITAIATIGALSTGGNGDDPSPDSLVDLNETDPQGEQTADGTQTGKENLPDLSVADKEEPDDAGNQVADKAGDSNDAEKDSHVAVVTPTGEDAEQTADNGGTDASDKKDQTAQNTDVSQNGDTTRTAEQDEDASGPDQTAVLSPQLIAEQLNFDRNAGLLWPVQGDVVIPYSPEHGVYHYTLDQFGTSDALVLSSAVGTEVKAAAKGVVTDISEEVRTGTTVTLALGNNTTLVYGQLDVTNLNEGDIVEAGECLGTVAEPTRYYVVEGPNLFFQVKEGEKSIDPQSLLKTE